LPTGPISPPSAPRSTTPQRGSHLTRHLLAFARRQPLQPRETDVNGLVIDTAKLLGLTLGEHIEIESMLQDDAWPAMVDPSQLSTALLNLALNARDAMSNGGRLMLETSNATIDQSVGRTHSELRPGGYIVVSVSDTGSGVPAAIRDRIFEPFFTTKAAGKGTGLGLSMVYGFVKQSNGHVSIYSEVDHGTTVKLYLPRCDGQARVVAAGTSTAVHVGTETILVVEDDALVRSYVVAQLASLGYTVLSAGSGAEALALIDQGAEFDLLFTDVIMPGMNGRQLVEELAKRRSGLRVLYTSGYTEHAIVHHGRLDPGVALLNKPYRKVDLAQKIREVLAAASRTA
jgi:CheY-like chemotaxis protein